MLRIVKCDNITIDMMYIAKVDILRIFYYFSNIQISQYGILSRKDNLTVEFYLNCSDTIAIQKKRKKDSVKSLCTYPPKSYNLMHEMFLARLIGNTVCFV